MISPYPLIEANADTELAEIDRSPRDQQLDHLMDLQAAYREKALAGDPKAADVVLKVSDRLAKLCGWEAPARLEVEQKGTLAATLVALYSEQRPEEREPTEEQNGYTIKYRGALIPADADCEPE